MNMTTSFQRAEAMKKKAGVKLTPASALPLSPLDFEQKQKRRAEFSTILGGPVGAERFGG